MAFYTFKWSTADADGASVVVRNAASEVVASGSIPDEVSTTNEAFVSYSVDLPAGDTYVASATLPDGRERTAAGTLDHTSPAALSATFALKGETGGIDGSDLPNRSASALSLPTYDGNPNVTHPSVLDLGTPWNGYRYWMGVTPYPNGARENPSILASTDGETWVVPAGVTNPVVTLAELSALGLTYWSDPELVMLDANTMALYYRGYTEGAGSVDKVFRKTSTNGTTWSAGMQVLSGAGVTMLSPAVIKDGSTFVMWTANDSVSPAIMERRTSADGLTWSAPTAVTITDHVAGYPSFWHLAVQKVGNTYWMLANSKPNHPRLWWLTSTDGLTWSYVGKALPLSGQKWDAGGHYRSAFVATGTNPPRFSVWLSGFTADNISNIYTGNAWRVGLMRNVDPQERVAITQPGAGDSAAIWRTPGEMVAQNSAVLGTVGNQQTWTLPETAGSPHGVYVTQLLPEGTVGVQVEAWLAAAAASQMYFGIRVVSAQSLDGGFPAGVDSVSQFSTVQVPTSTGPRVLGTLRFPTPARYVVINVWRQSDNAADTSTAAAYLRGLRLVPVR